MSDEDFLFFIKVPRLENGLVMPIMKREKFQNKLLNLLNIRRQESTSTRIRLNDWIKLGKEHLDLDEKVCLVLFFCFETVNNQNPNNQLTATDHEMKAIQGKSHLEFLCKRSLHFGSFLIFIWCHFFQDENEKLRYSDWAQDHTTLKYLSKIRRLKLKERLFHQDHFLFVIRNNLTCLLRFLSRQNDRISGKSLNRLSFLIEGGKSFHQTIPDGLSSMLPFWEGKSLNISVDIETVSSWIKDRLVVNSTLYSDINLYEKIPLSPHRRIIDIHTVMSQTVQIVDARMKQVRVLACRESYIYILCPVEYLLIIGCSKCTIVCGPVQKIVTVDGCEECRVIVPCRTMKISNSFQSVVYTCINTPPLVENNCSDIKFGPFNTYYENLEKDCQEAGVNPKLNQFRVPIVYPETKKQVVSTLPPGNFSQFVIPFEKDSSNMRVNPCVIPYEYGVVIQKKMGQVAKVFQVFRRAVKQNPHQIQEYQQFVNSEFRKWLLSNDSWHEISSLMDYTE